MVAPKNGILVGVEDSYGNIIPEQQIDDPTAGDLAVFDGSVWVAINAGPIGYQLQSQGPGAVPVWSPPGSAVPATQVGQVLYSVDGATFTAEVAITSRNGWLVNNSGLLLVQG